MNTLTNYFVPQWVSILFLIAITVPVFLISFVAKKGALQNEKKKVFYSTFLFLLFYFLYVAIACISGLFNKVFFPPIVLIYTTIPFALILFIIVLNLKIFKTIFNNLKIEDIIQLHIFRVIGVFFLLLAFYNTLPKFFCIVAGCGDIITAITSIYVVKAVKNKKSYSRKLIYAWNTFGLIDILFTAISANVLTKLSIQTGSLGVDTLAQFPFCFIPAFAPPTIIFLHVLIFIKLKKSNAV